MSAPQPQATTQSDAAPLLQELAARYPYPVFLVDVEADRFLWASPGATTLTALPLPQLLEQPARQLFTAHANPSEALLELFERRTPQATVEFSYRSPAAISHLQGYWTHIRANYYALILHDVTQVRLAQDELAQYAEELQQQVEALTELKEALEKSNRELAESKDQLRLLAAVAAYTDNAVVITDAQGRAVWVNKGFERIAGYTLEEVRGKVPGKLLQGPETDPATVARIREKLQRKEPFVEEILNYAKDGRPYWLRLYITPLTNELNEVVNYMAIELDITEEKKRMQMLQQQLRDSQEAQSYAARIFRRFLPEPEGLRTYFSDAAVWNAPLSGVGGDFYFYAPQEGQVVLALGDSTGHGTAAALISVYALTSLWRSTREPVQNLQGLYEDLLSGILLDVKSREVEREGFELVLLRYEPASSRLEYLGARRPLWIYRQGQLHEIRGTRTDISPEARSLPLPELQSMRLQPGDRLYLFSDGLVDQLSPAGKKFTPNRLRSFLQTNQYLPLTEQVELLRQAISQWRGETPQVDDILFLTLEV